MTPKRIRRVPDYIEHIIAAIDRIESYVAGLDRMEFIETAIVQDAVIRNFCIIGEAANSIIKADTTFALQHPDLRLELAYNMRNALIHGYDSVNLLTVWNTIQEDLPPLKRRLVAVLITFPDEG